MSAYLAVDVERCRRSGHRFTIAGSDKTPLKRNLICDTCSGDGKTAYAAYGSDVGSFGQWKSRSRRDQDRAIQSPVEEEE